MKLCPFVVKMTTIICLLAAAAKKKQPIYQRDVNTAFLHGDLFEDIFMKPPAGLDVPCPTVVCKLKKSLYRMTQASKQWYAKLSKTLRSHGFQHSKNDYSLLSKQQGQSIVLLAVFVDDIVITGNNPEEITTLKGFLDDKLKIKVIGELNYFLGWVIVKVSNGLILTQRKFSLDLLKEFKCDTISSTTCPLGPLSKTAAPEDPLSDATTYRKLVGKLNYLTNTRLYIVFSVQYLSQFLQAPTKSNMTAALHTLRYIKQNPSQGLIFNDKSDYSLQAYCDSDWAQCPCTRNMLVAIILCQEEVLSLEN